jgi:hypothetical protein
MKNIDMKSLLIGGLLASTIFFGVAATSPTDKWDKNQRWQVTEFSEQQEKNGDTVGWEPTGHMRVRVISQFNKVWMSTYRRRVK